MPGTYCAILPHRKLAKGEKFRKTNMADKILLTVNKMGCRILLWRKSMCTLFKHDCRSEDPCDWRCKKQGPVQLVLTEKFLEDLHRR
jgi:hypothetical protein